MNQGQACQPPTLFSAALALKDAPPQAFTCTAISMLRISFTIATFQESTERLIARRRLRLQMYLAPNVGHRRRLATMTLTQIALPGALAEESAALLATFFAEQRSRGA